MKFTTWQYNLLNNSLERPKRLKKALSIKQIVALEYVLLIHDIIAKPNNVIHLESSTRLKFSINNLLTMHDRNFIRSYIGRNKNQLH